MVRLGVFICHCGKNIAGNVDVKVLARFASEQPEVVYAKNNAFLCSEQGQESVVHGLGNRVSVDPNAGPPPVASHSTQRQSGPCITPMPGSEPMESPFRRATF